MGGRWLPALPETVKHRATNIRVPLAILVASYCVTASLNSTASAQTATDCFLHKTSALTRSSDRTWTGRRDGMKQHDRWSFNGIQHHGTGSIRWASWVRRGE